MIHFHLMHRDTKCGFIRYDDSTDRIVSYKDFGTGASPFLGNANEAKIKKWWEMRAVPASRSALGEMLKEAGCTTAGHFLAKNLALSMTDAYWIRPEESDVRYDNVKFTNLGIFYDGKVPYHNAASYNPNASLGGQMDKYWDLSGPKPVLVKESYRYYGQQSVNEAFAALVHARQEADIPFVKYRVSATADKGLLCKCDAFTSDRAEFIPAYEVVESAKKRNDIALYDAYIDICVSLGIDRSQMQAFMDYQTLTDFAISNTDEHLLNFGILRNPENMQILGPAPVFDSGNSMFYADSPDMVYSRAGLLERKVTSFYEKEEQLLKKVHDKGIVKVDLLPDKKEVKEFFAGFHIPEQKAETISKNYGTKVQLLEEFQKGKTISLYSEKRAERAVKTISHVQINRQKFVMICGLPGSGKTKKMLEMIVDQKKTGTEIADAARFFRVDEALPKTRYYLDAQEILGNIHPSHNGKNTVCGISLNEIKGELKQKSGDDWEDLAFTIAKAQVKAALLSGASVIYDAANLSKDTRKQFLEIAEAAGVQTRELHVMDAPEKSWVGENLLRMMQAKLSNNKPTLDEGWTSISMNAERWLNVELEVSDETGLD